jgi:hypothetical protein
MSSHSIRTNFGDITFVIDRTSVTKTRVRWELTVYRGERNSASWQRIVERLDHTFRGEDFQDDQIEVTETAYTVSINGRKDDYAEDLHMWVYEAFGIGPSPTEIEFKEIL